MQVLMSCLGKFRLNFYTVLNYFPNVSRIGANSSRVKKKYVSVQTVTKGAVRPHDAITPALLKKYINCFALKRQLLFFEI